MTPSSPPPCDYSCLPGSFPTFSSNEKAHDDPLPTLDSNPGAFSFARKRLRRRRVLVGSLTLVVQIWSAFLAGRYLVGFFQDPSPLSLSSSTSSLSPTRALALICFSLSTITTLTTFSFILLLRYIYRPPTFLRHPKSLIVLLRTLLFLSNLLGLLIPATLNLVLVLLWRRLPACTTVSGAPVGVDVLWIIGIGSSATSVCVEAGWKWINAAAGRLGGTALLVAIQTPLLYTLLPRLLLPPDPSLLPTTTPVEYEEFSRSRLLRARSRSGLLPQPHDAYPLPERKTWWEGLTGYNAAGELYLEEKVQRDLLRLEREEGGTDLGEVVGDEWEVGEERSRRTSADSVASDVPLLSRRAPSAGGGRSRGRVSSRYLSRRKELSQVESVGSEEEEEEWVDAREQLGLRSESREGWRGMVEVGMSR